jgi:hypothetical protein
VVLPAASATTALRSAFFVRLVPRQCCAKRCRNREAAQVV